jgi:Na+-driven multidrug efflux pump
VICIPLCYVFGHVLGYGVHGLLWSLFAGLAVASVLLIGRFKVLSSRAVRPF